MESAANLPGRVGALNTQRACRLVKQARSTYYYHSVKNPQTALRQRMREIA
jgi:putative transposase